MLFYLRASGRLWNLPKFGHFLIRNDLAGSQDLRAPDDRVIRHIHPSIVETLPEDFPDLKHEFARLESQMFDRPKRPGQAPLTRVLPDAHDRIFSPGYRYDPVNRLSLGSTKPQWESYPHHEARSDLRNSLSNMQKNWPIYCTRKTWSVRQFSNFWKSQ